MRAFFAVAVRNDAPLSFSGVTVGELRRGFDMIRHRGDEAQAVKLERWLKNVTLDYADSILSFDVHPAQL